MKEYLRKHLEDDWEVMCKQVGVSQADCVMLFSICLQRFVILCNDFKPITTSEMRIMFESDFEK